MKINGMKASFHHMGIPTTERRPDERFSERLGCTPVTAIAGLCAFNGTVSMQPVAYTR
jgi:hypothetical protein